MSQLLYISSNVPVEETRRFNPSRAHLQHEQAVISYEPELKPERLFHTRDVCICVSLSLSWWLEMSWKNKNANTNSQVQLTS